MTAVLDVFVPGRPKTKGSMRIVNSSRHVLTEAVEGSVRWRQLVAYAVREQVARIAINPPDGVEFPLTGPVAVTLNFGLPVPPTGARAGDIDKLERNILDALSSCLPKCGAGCHSHAGVYVDDVQVVALCSTKTGPGATVGVRIRVASLAAGDGDGSG